MLTTSGSMWFRNGATDSVNMAITKSGFIGIGTKTPDASLHIAANDSKVELLVGDAVMRGDDGASRIMIGNTDAHSFLRAGQDTTLGLSVGWRYNADTSLAFGQITTFNNAVSPLVLQSTGGKVGIGSTSPAAKLDVLGNIKIADGTQAAGRVLTSDASGLASWAAPGAVTGWGLAGNDIYNANSGNVGIGTTQPSQSLLMVSTNTSGNNWIARFLNTANATNTYCDGIQIMAGNNAGTQLSYMITFNRPDGNSIGTVTLDASNSVVYATTSDQRLKNNFHPTKLGLKDLNRST